MPRRVGYLTHNNVIYDTLKEKARGIAFSEAARPHTERKHGGAHPSALTIPGGSFSHDEANPRLQKSAVGFARSPLWWCSVFLQYLFLNSALGIGRQYHYGTVK